MRTKREDLHEKDVQKPLRERKAKRRHVCLKRRGSETEIERVQFIRECRKRDAQQHLQKDEKYLHGSMFHILSKKPAETRTFKEPPGLQREYVNKKVNLRNEPKWKRIERNEMAR
jgi:hypothetical protein